MKIKSDQSISSRETEEISKCFTVDQFKKKFAAQVNLPNEQNMLLSSTAVMLTIATFNVSLQYR